jgi:hypothetical protein
MDPTNRTLDSMITVPHPSQIGDFTESNPRGEDRPSKRRAVDVLDDEQEMEEEVDGNSAWTKGSAIVPESECDFTSIHQLRQEASKGNQGKPK